MSDCGNYNTSASKNPKYCYRWSFLEPKKVAVFNLWYHQMEEKDGCIFRKLNMRAHADTDLEPNKTRALKFDEALQTAISENLPVRVVIQKRKDGPDWIVVKRSLDPMPWTITDYNTKTGDCTLMRGVHTVTPKTEQENSVDDLADIPLGNSISDRASVITKVIQRDNQVRAYVLRRAKGKCEYCGVQGFTMTNGGFYVETHHVIALCDAGRDAIDNVIALCPQHHRQAHYGVNAEELEAVFIKILEKKNPLRR